jgi:hypothetical protein
MRSYSTQVLVQRFNEGTLGEVPLGCILLSVTGISQVTVQPIE